MVDNIFIQKIDISRKKVFSKRRYCLYPGCNKKAINSHVFPKGAILDSISGPDYHFYSLKFPSIFVLQKEQIFKLNKIGIDKGYSFPGFCNYHDNEIFYPIEKMSFDPFAPFVQVLFTYRTICMELRKKEIAKEATIEIAKIIYESKKPNWLIHYIKKDQEIKDFAQAIMDLNLFKSQLEKEIFCSDSSMFKYNTIQLPRLDVCISTPLNILDPKNEKSIDIDEYGLEKEVPLSTSVLNFFPYKESSFLIAANHKDYSCNWTLKLLERIKNHPDSYLKEISDIITFRCDFWAISQQLYNSFSQDKVIEFENLSSKYFNNCDYSINCDFNLFEV